MGDRYRKKPVVIEAMQFDGTLEGATRVVVWAGGNLVASEERGVASIEIPTLEGTLTASSGDWVIRGVKGELYPCKPDIFEATYEPVAE